MHMSARLLLSIVAAIAAAALLAHFAHDDLGLSRHAVRTDALLSAAGLSGFLMLFLYSDRFGNRR
jgi:hypothetical protein